jgi:purine-cytosine permease-like protein
MFAYVLFKIAATYDVTRAFAFVPAAGGLSFLFLTDAVFGGWGGTSLTLIADYSRYARNRAVTLSGGVAAVVVSTFVVSVGAMATIASGNRDITMTLLQLGLGFSAMIVVIFATWTTNPCNTYSAGLSLSNITGWGRVTGVAAMGTVGISLALLGILEHMVYFLEVVGLTLAPANSILLVEYFFFARQRVDTRTLLDGGGPYDYWRGINPAAVAAWGLALAVILLLNFVARAPWLALPALSTCVLTGILYAIFRWALMRRAARQAPAQ